MYDGQYDQPKHPQDKLTIVTEYIVASAGRLIGAPVCETAIVTIPTRMSGIEFRPRHFLNPGFAHGSRAIMTTREYRHLTHRERDYNRIRHVGVFALYDWCWGKDPQWLHDLDADLQLYSHDHGWYLTGNQGHWTEQTLRANVDSERPLPVPQDGLNVGEAGRIAARLMELTRAEIQDILCRVPSTWPVSESALECAGWFLERRASLVADRLQQMSDRLTNTWRLSP